MDEAWQIEIEKGLSSQFCCVKIGTLQNRNCLCPYCNLTQLLLTLDHHFTSKTCDSHGHNDRIKQHYNSQVSALLVLVLWGVHLEMSWQASQFLVQLLAFPSSIINAFDSYLTPSVLKMMLAFAAVFYAILLPLPHFIEKK